MTSTRVVDTIRAGLNQQSVHDVAISMLSPTAIALIFKRRPSGQLMAFLEEIATKLDVSLYTFVSGFQGMDETIAPGDRSGDDTES